MKVVIFGEYKVERMAGPLLAHGCDLVIYTEEPIGDMVGPGVAQRPLDPGSSVHDIVAILDAQQPDVAMTSIFALGQEQMLTAYSQAAQKWGGRFVVHPPAFAELACDKVRLYQTARRRGWPVPEGAVCASLREARTAGDDLGWPVVVKLARTQAGDGVYHVASAQRLAELAGRLTYPLVVMRFCRGVELGVELVSGMSGYARWPVESAGPLDERLSPLRRPRVSPFLPSAAVQRELDDLIDDITENYRPWGGWQLDLAVAEGRLLLLEINGRLGGLSELGLTTTGVDPHSVAALDAIGAVPPPIEARRVGLEVTGTAGAAPAPLADGMSLIEIGWNSTHRSLKGTSMAQYILGAARPADAQAWVLTMAERGLRVAVADALAQLDLGFAALTAVRA